MFPRVPVKLIQLALVEDPTKGVLVGVDSSGWYMVTKVFQKRVGILGNVFYSVKEIEETINRKMIIVWEKEVSIKEELTMTK